MPNPKINTNFATADQPKENQMKILTPRNNKDYYDYLTGIYGEDEKVVFDRRSFTVLSNLDSPFFSYIPTSADSPKKEVRQRDWTGNRLKWVTKYEATELYCILEVGLKQYSFQVERYLDEDSKVCIDWKLLGIKSITKKDRVGSNPMTFFKAKSRYSFFWRDEIPELVIEKDGSLPNPILTGTPITSLIPAQELYQELSSYLSSLNDKEIIDNRTEIEKAESAGFDRKTSFRNIK